MLRIILNEEVEPAMLTPHQRNSHPEREGGEEITLLKATMQQVKSGIFRRRLSVAYNIVEIF